MESGGFEGGAIWCGVRVWKFGKSVMDGDGKVLVDVLAEIC